MKTSECLAVGASPAYGANASISVLPMFHDVDLGFSSRTPARFDPSDKRFSAFVSDERDLVGMVAYAIHERQAREWQAEMTRECGRAPTEEEIRAYAVGETTPRRILAYRFLAAEHLAGRGSDAATRALSSDPLFSLFCSSEYDFIGVVAYAIHEQQRREWREAMQREFGRSPSEREIAAHRVSETTPRRILAYRFLAEQRLAGRGPDLTPGVAKVSFIQRALTAGARAEGGTRRWPSWRKQTKRATPSAPGR